MNAIEGIKTSINDYIIRAVEAAPEGSVIGVGTEVHLVLPRRLNGVDA